jgi:hypothetical protein
MTFENTPVVTGYEIGAIPLAPSVNNHYGDTALLLEKTAAATVLVLMAKKGTWNIRLGDQTGVGEMPSTYLAGVAIDDGTAGFPIPEGVTRVFFAPNNLTVKGYASTSELVYYYL